MTIYMIGGVAFCGFPSALRLSSEGHVLKIIDSLSRRKLDNELCVKSLTLIKSITQYLQIWNVNSKKPINFINIAQKYIDRVNKEMIFCVSK